MIFGCVRCHATTPAASQSLSLRNHDNDVAVVAVVVRELNRAPLVRRLMGTRRSNTAMAQTPNARTARLTLVATTTTTTTMMMVVMMMMVMIRPSCPRSVLLLRCLPNCCDDPVLLLVGFCFRGVHVLVIHSLAAT